MFHSHSEGLDFMGSNAAEEDVDADPSREAEDWSCWVTAAVASVVSASGVVLVTSVTGNQTLNETIGARTTEGEDVSERELTDLWLKPMSRQDQVLLEMLELLWKTVVTQRWRDHHTVVFFLFFYTN